MSASPELEEPPLPTEVRGPSEELGEEVHSRDDTPGCQSRKAAARPRSGSAFGARMPGDGGLVRSEVRLEAVLDAQLVDDCLPRSTAEATPHLRFTYQARDRRCDGRCAHGRDDEARRSICNDLPVIAQKIVNLGRRNPIRKRQTPGPSGTLRRQSGGAGGRVGGRRTTDVPCEPGAVARGRTASSSCSTVIGTLMFGSGPRLPSPRSEWWAHESRARRRDSGRESGRRAKHRYLSDRL